jgi:hypothetical protein
MRAPRLVRGLAALGVLLGIVWALHSCTGLTIPVGSSAELSDWADDTPPPMMAAAVVRLAAMGAAVYSAGMVTLVLVADVARCRALAYTALGATPAILRRALGGGAAQVALVAGTVVVTAPVAAAQEPAQTTATMARVPPEPAPVATMVWVGQVEPPPQSTPASTVPAAAPSADDAWLVEPGDSFWSIAEEVVDTHSSSTSDVTAYWQQLIAANRDRLVSPDCPDLLIPGQTLVLPTP